MLKVNNLPPISAPGLDGWVSGGAVLAPVANSMPSHGHITQNTLPFNDSETSSSSDSASDVSSPISSIASDPATSKPAFPFPTPSSLPSSVQFAPSLPSVPRAASFPVASSCSNGLVQQWPQLTRHYSTSDAFPPSSVLERHRKAKFVDSLIGIAVHVIETIWANHSSSTRTKILPLPTFITETLRRSRTSCSTLQTAMLYIFRIKDAVMVRRKAASGTMAAAGVNTYPASMSSILCTPTDHAMCGRRMFLAALISASKFLQDRNFSNRAWAKLTGLTVTEINANELTFLKLIDYNLFVKPELYHRWNMFLSEHIHMSSHVEQSRLYASSIAQNVFITPQSSVFDRSPASTPFMGSLPSRSSQISPLATPSALGYLMTPSTRRGSVTLSEFSLTMSDGTPTASKPLDDGEQVRTFKQGLVQRYLDMLSLPSESLAYAPSCIPPTHMQYPSPSPSPSPVASLRQRSNSRPWVASPSSYTSVTVDGFQASPVKAAAGRKRGIADMSNDCQEWSKRLRES